MSMNSKCCFCQQLLPTEHLHGHLKTCDQRIVTCNCGFQVPLNQLHVHRQVNCGLVHQQEGSVLSDIINTTGQQNSNGQKRNYFEQQANNNITTQSTDFIIPAHLLGNTNNACFSPDVENSDINFQQQSKRSRTSYNNNDNINNQTTTATQNNSAVTSTGPNFINYANGDKYLGAHHGSSREGHGVLTLANDEVYDGMWQNNALNGHGTACYPGGRKYSGEWLNGKRNGQGTEFSSNGNCYMGEFLANAKHGKGLMMYKENQGVYDGEWVSGRHSGFGTMFASDSLYRGQFFEGRKHGRGCIQYASGKVFMGTWDNGQKIRNAPVTTTK